MAEVDPGGARFDGEAAHASDRQRALALQLVGLRLVLAVAALPLTPVLRAEHFLWVLVLRPTRDFLVVAGYLARADHFSLTAAVGAGLPLLLLGVWAFYYLGWAWRDPILAGDLPESLRRYLHPKVLGAVRRILDRRGTLLVPLARLAIFPTVVLAAAAGASAMRTRRYLVADTVGALLGISLYLGLGYTLGQAHERAGLWLAVIGGGLLLVMLWIVGRALRTPRKRPDVV